MTKLETINAEDLQNRTYEPTPFLDVYKRQEQAVFLFLQRYLTSLRPNPSGRRSRQLKIHNPVTVPAGFRYNLLSH